MPIEGKAVLNKDHSFTNFPVTISNNVKSSVSNWSVEGNGQQTGIPTPDNPIQPTFCGVRTGNLFDISGIIYGTWTNGSGVVQSYGYGARSVDIPSSQITVSFNDLVFPYSYSVVWVDSSGGFITRNHIGSTTQIREPQIFTPPSNAAKFYIQLANGTDSFYPITKEQIESYKIMLNLGSTALPYEPYGWKIPITCAGQTTPVYLGQVSTVRRVKKLVLDGNEAWDGYTSGRTGFRIVVSDASSVSQTVVTEAICSHFTADTYSNVYSDISVTAFAQRAGSTPATTGFIFRSQTYYTKGEFIQFLKDQYAAGTPVTVWYVLTTPETTIVNEPLAKIGDYADELLSTAQGTPQLTLSTEESNIISFETNLQPSKFNIKYYEKDYTKIKDIQMQIPTAKTYNYTEYPITINNAFSSNCNIDLFGNGIQNGTPSPDNPIIPEFCGDRTGNLAPPLTEWIDGYVGSSGQIAKPSESYLEKASDYLEIPNNAVSVAFSGGDGSFERGSSGGWRAIGFYDSNKTFVLRAGGSGINAMSASVPESARFMRISCRTYGSDKEYMLNLGSTALPYEPYGYKLNISSGGENLWDEDYTNISSTAIYRPLFVGDGYFTMSTTMPQYLNAAGLFLLSGQQSSGAASTALNGVWDGQFRTVQSQNGYITIVYKYFQASGVYISPVDYQTMLNLGNTPKSYSPYNRTATTTYFGETPTVRQIKKLVFDGTENWNINTTVVAPNNLVYTALGNALTGISPFCTHYEGTDKNTWAGLPLNNITVSIVSGGVIQCVINIGDTILADFKSYLAAQYAAGTPVTVWYVLAEPETSIVNEPLAKIGDYSDELQTTIQLEPFNQNLISIDTQLQPSKVSLTYKTKESTDPYKSVKYVLDNNNNYVYKSPYFYTWEGIREIVRAGKASQYYPIGSIIYDNFNESTGTAFQVVAYNNHFDPTLTAQGYTHSMTLCELLLTDVITFDAQEAFLYTEVDIPAGTYKFTIPNYDATYGGDKTYYFTSTVTLPSGSQIVMNWPYQQTPKTVTGYVGPNPQTNTTALSGFSALTLTEWVDGTSPEATDLGTITGPTTQLGTSNYGQMNHIHRARYGSNNYLQSGIRQYINSNSAANTWWTPQTIFDRPYGSRATAGKLTKLNQDLISVMVTPEIKSRTNSYFETTSLDGTTFTLSTDYTINTDKMFLLSPMEVNFNTTDTTIGTTLDYYIEATNETRIKKRKSNNNAYYWWLRTPYPSYAGSVRFVGTSGALDYYGGASNSIGAAPACVIQ